MDTVVKTGANSWFKFKSTAFYTELRKNVCHIS